MLRPVRHSKPSACPLQVCFARHSFRKLIPVFLQYGRVQRLRQAEEDTASTSGEAVAAPPPLKRFPRSNRRPGWKKVDRRGTQPRRLGRSTSEQQRIGPSDLHLCQGAVVLPVSFVPVLIPVLRDPQEYYYNYLEPHYHGNPHR